MNTAIDILVLVQAAGAAIGAGGSVLAELFYLRAIQDGRIDDAEKAHLKRIATALRWGMLLVLISSIGLVTITFAYTSNVPLVFTSGYWVEMTLSLLIITVAWALSRKRISFVLGSAALFTAWWLLAFLVFGSLPNLTFGAAMMAYVVCTGLFAALLSYARMITNRSA